MLRLAIKVDVDTCTGLQEGVPNLLALLRRYAVPARFFVAFGPDDSGLRRLETHGEQGLCHRGPDQIPRCPIRPRPIPGRAGAVACQVIDAQTRDTPNGGAADRSPGISVEARPP